MALAKWEYEYVPMVAGEWDRRLQELGNEGWEVCATVSTVIDVTFFVLKRQKEVTVDVMSYKSRRG